MGSLRYSLSLYVPFTILVAVWLGKIFQFSKALGSAVLVGLLCFNLFLHYLFLNEFKNLPYRPVDQLIKALKDKGSAMLMPIIVFLKSLPLRAERKLSVPIFMDSAIIIISGRLMPHQPKKSLL